jgi:acyl-CoA reductase-like NAD-dependent aldehyde dehydrogenase
LPGTERGQLINKLADLIEQHREVLATIETWDNGLYITTDQVATAADTTL